MIAFPRVRTIIYNYNIILSCVTCASMRYALYTLLRMLRHSGGLGQLMGLARYRTRTRALQDQLEERNL